MATFKFGRTVDIHWNGYDIVGPADTVFSIPDQLYEEFDADISGVEPTLVWIDTNEFQTLQDSVVTSTIVGSSFITTASTTAGTQISIVSGSATNGYVLTANGSGGVSFAAAPGGAGSLSAVIGTSPISVLTSSGTATVSLNANYQTAGTYVTSVIGSAPVSASGTTAITVSIDQTALSVSNADTATTLRTYVKNASGSTITKGQAVYITGADGTNALIGLASATSDAASSKTLGIAANTMTNNAFGYVIENGQLSNIDTSATTAGAAIWLGNTPGSLVFGAPPAEPSHAVYLGVVTKANVSTGEILVKVQNGYELDELHDVFVGGVSTALPLVYNSTSSGWIAQALSSVGIADNAVVEAKINAGAVTSAKIGDGAVVAAKINAGAVDTSKISSGLAAAGTFLRSDGAGAAAFANISQAVVSEFTVSGTWTKPSGTTAVYVLAVGGGGGGSGAARNAAVASVVGAGGNGGSIVQRFLIGSSVSSSVTVTIGQAGVSTAGSTSAQSTAGASGSSTTFGTDVYAQGGAGGAGTNAARHVAVGRTLMITAAVNASASLNNSVILDGAGAMDNGASSANQTIAADGLLAAGGGGGGHDTGNGTRGGIYIALSTSTNGLGGGAIGGTYSTTGNGGDGGNGTKFGEGGGGGGGSNFAGSTGGRGGNGYLGGGGGGGGDGASFAGAGGAGGSGYCLVISW